MKIALVIAGVIAGLVLVVVIVGATLPQAHRASRERVFQATPAALYDIVATPAAYPSWRSGVSRVEMLPDEGGKPRFREFDGSDAITYTVDERVPGQRLVTRISDRSLPFGGKWTFELIPEGAGTRLRITEDGEVYNPVFRFVSRFLMGHHATIDRYLADLERRVAAPK